MKEAASNRFEVTRRIPIASINAITKGKGEDKKAKEQIQNLHYTLYLHIHYIYIIQLIISGMEERERGLTV